MPPVATMIPDEDTVRLNSHIDRYYAEIFAYLHHLLGERNLTQDLAHQVFMAPGSERLRLARAADPRPLLYRRASELACAQSGECRPRRRFPLHPAGPREVVASSAPETRWGKPSRLQLALTALPFQERAAVLLVGHFDLTLADAAACLNLRPASLRRLLDHAFLTLASSYRQDALVQAVPGSSSAPELGSRAAPDSLTASDHAAVTFSHEQIQARIPAFAWLPEEDKTAILRHTAGCSACEAELTAYRRISQDLETMPDAWVSRHAQERLYAAVKTSIEDLTTPVRPRRFTTGPAVLALIVVFIVAGAWLGGQIRLAPAATAAGRSASPVVSPSATPAAAQQPAALASPVPITETLPAGMTAADVKWLRQNAIALNTTQPGTSSPADLVPLKSVIGNARVVAFADSSYGTQELYGLKQRLLEFLVEQMNFNTLAIDSSWAQTELLANYLQTGNGDPERLALLLTGGYRQSPDLLKTIEWLRAHNQDPLGDPKVSVHGFDILQTYSHIPRDGLTAYLDKVDPAGTAMAQDNNADLYRYMVAHRSDFLAQSSFGEFNVALRNARALVQYDAFASAGDATGRALVRNQFMAENVLSMLRGVGGANRLILWGQASDLAVDNQSGNLGAILRQRFGQNYVVIDLAFYQGTLSASSAVADETAGPIEIHRVDPPPSGTYEDYLNLAGPPLFMLSLRSARTGETLISPTGDLYGRLPPYIYQGGSGGYPGAAPYPGTGARGMSSRFGGGTDVTGANSSGTSGIFATPAAGGPGADLYARPYVARTPTATATPGPTPTPSQPLPGTVWLQGSHPARNIPGSYNDCDPAAQFAEIHLAEAFDAVIFVRTVSPASTLFQITGDSHPACSATPTPTPGPTH